MKLQIFLYQAWIDKAENIGYNSIVRGRQAMGIENTGAIIRELRLEKGLTQKQLAEMINVSDKAVSKWECGGSQI